MTDRSHHDSPSRLRPLDRVQDAVAAHAAGPQTAKSAPEFLAYVFGVDLEKGEGRDDCILDGSGESREILLRAAGEEQPRQGRGLA